MSDLAILVPVLGRPHRVQPLLDSVAGTTLACRVLFIADPDDRGEHDAIRAAAADMLIHRGNYAAKIAAGVAATDEPLIFTGADDLTPLPGWLDAAKVRLTGRVEVVGVNDLLPRRPGREGHATHFVMTRAYAERSTIDGGPGPFHQGYAHNFCDDELIATARKRAVYVYAEGSCVRHDHPMAGGEDDDTYRKGRATFRADRRIFQRRRRLWAA